MLLGLAPPTAEAKKICPRHHRHRCIKIPPSGRGQQGPKSLTKNNVVNGGGIGGGPGSHRDTALEWAMSQRGLSRWAWYCERFVEEAYGERGKFPKAASGARALKLSHGSPKTAPAGTLMYFAPHKANRRLGHVGISLGDGRMVSALSKVVVTDVVKDRFWRTLYRGWTDAPSGWRGRIPLPPGQALEDPSHKIRITAPAAGQSLDGIVDLHASTAKAAGVRFYGYYAAQFDRADSRAWHALGDGVRDGNGWVLAWDTLGVPTQDLPDWGTVNVAAVLLDGRGDETGTRDYRRFAVDHPGPVPNRPPTVDSMAPTGIVPGVAPTLTAGASDPEGDPLQYDFKLSGPGADLDSGWIGTAAWQAPKRTLVTSTDYAWSVSVRDPSGSVATRAASLRTAALPSAAQVAPTSGAGYWQVSRDGRVYVHGDARFFGDLPTIGTSVSNIIAIARTPSDEGYWLLGSDGGVFAFGDADPLGSMGGKQLNRPMVGMAPTKTGKGYWLVGADGGVFAFGDADPTLGSMGGKPMNRDVSGIAATPSSAGYWLVGQDGGLFRFGDALDRGNLVGKPVAAIVDFDPTPSGGGYWMTASDGAVYPFGDAAAIADEAGKEHAPITGLTPNAYGSGYWLVACDGGIYTFGGATFHDRSYTNQC